MHAHAHTSLWQVSHSCALGDPNAPFALEDLCEFFSQCTCGLPDIVMRDFWDNAAANPHITPALYKKYKDKLAGNARSIMLHSYAVMEFVKRCKVAVIGAWIDPRQLIRWAASGRRTLPHSRLVHHYKSHELLDILRVRCITLPVLRVLGFHLHDLISGRLIHHMRVRKYHSMSRRNNMNHKDYEFSARNVTWAFLCELNAAASAADIASVYNNMSWMYLADGPTYPNAALTSLPILGTTSRRDLPFVCPVCSAEVPDAPLDAAANAGLHMYARFWSHNVFITPAFVEQHIAHVNWHKLSKNRAIWQNVDSTDNTHANTILARWHARLHPILVSVHAPLNIYRKYYPDAGLSSRALTRNPTCPRVHAVDSLTTFARYALPRAELDALAVFA